MVSKKATKAIEETLSEIVESFSTEEEKFELAYNYPVYVTDNEGVQRKTFALIIDKVDRETKKGVVFYDAKYYVEGDKVNEAKALAFKDMLTLFTRTYLYAAKHLSK
jgi:hypothetical protein